MTSTITLADIIAIADARGESIEATIKRIDKLTTYGERKVTVPVAKGTPNVVKPRAKAANAGRKVAPKAAPAKARTRKPKAVKPVATITLDPTVGNGASMRMTLRGVEMPTDKPASTKRIMAIQDKYDRKVIVKAAVKLGLKGKSLHTLNVADASDLLFTLKGGK